MVDFTSAAPPRFFVEGPLAPGRDVELPERAARHISVLRLKEGDRIELFNGEGGEYQCTLSHMARSAMRARVGAWQDIERESGIEITLAQGLSAGDRMDFAVQKATELGARTIWPVATERSVVRLSEERAERRLAHWRGIAAASCEQCGRNRLPVIHPVSTLGAFLQEANPDALRLVLAPGGDTRLRDLEPSEKVVLLIGAEGGLTDAEEQRARRAGFTAVRMGPRIMRTETAPLAAIAALQSMWGDA